MVVVGLAKFLARMPNIADQEHWRLTQIVA